MLCTGPRDVVRCASAATSPYRQLGTDDAQEFGEVITRMTQSIVCVAVAALAGVALYAHEDAAAACDSDPAQGQVYRVLQEQFHLQSVFLHDFTTLSGGYFSTVRECVAEVAEIRGNVDASGMNWRRIRFRVARSDNKEHPDVTVELGDAAPFVPPPEPTFWSYLRSLL